MHRRFRPQKKNFCKSSKLLCIIYCLSFAMLSYLTHGIYLNFSHPALQSSAMNAGLNTWEKPPSFAQNVALRGWEFNMDLRKSPSKSQTVFLQILESLLQLTMRSLHVRKCKLAEISPVENYYLLEVCSRKLSELRKW